MIVLSLFRFLEISNDHKPSRQFEISPLVRNQPGVVLIVMNVSIMQPHFRWKKLLFALTEHTRLVIKIESRSLRYHHGQMTQKSPKLKVASERQGKSSECTNNGELEISFKKRFTLYIMKFAKRFHFQISIIFCNCDFQCFITEFSFVNREYNFTKTNDKIFGPLGLVRILSSSVAILYVQNQ